MEEVLMEKTGSRKGLSFFMKVMLIIGALLLVLVVVFVLMNLGTSPEALEVNENEMAIADESDQTSLLIEPDIGENCDENKAELWTKFKECWEIGATDLNAQFYKPAGVLKCRSEFDALEIPESCRVNDREVFISSQEALSGVLVKVIKVNNMMVADPKNNRGEALELVEEAEEEVGRTSAVIGLEF